MPRSIRAGITIGSVLTSLLLTTAGAAVAELHISIRPQISCARPADEFDAEIWVDEAGSEFDGYEAIVRFDGDLLDTVRVEQGPLMREACANQPWFYVTVTDSTVYISHVILCGGLTLRGPGHLSTIRFRAAAQLGSTALELFDVEFYRAGVLVPDVFTQDGWVSVAPQCAGACCGSDGSCSILPEYLCFEQGRFFKGIDVPCEPDPCSNSGAGDFQENAPIRLEAVPNPFRTEVRLVLSGDLRAWPADRIRIFDSTGRVVRSLAGERRPDRMDLLWDGRDDRGARVSPGVYFVSVPVGAESGQPKLVLLE